MKRQLLKISAVVGFIVGVVATSAQAQSNTVQTANIPFAFTVGKKQLPAGEYTIRRVNPVSDKAVLLIQNADRRVSVMMQTMPVESGKAEATAKLIFNRYEEQYFLSQVWMPADSTGLKLQSSRRERELARNRNKKGPERETVALDSQQR